MTPESLDLMLSRACAYGSTLNYVLWRMNGVIPAIVRWGDDGRTTLCGPWSPLGECAETWAEYANWHVFDYIIGGMRAYDVNGDVTPTTIITLDIKKYERRDTDGEGKAQP